VRKITNRQCFDVQQRQDSSTVGDYISSPEEEELFVANRNTTIDDEGGHS
jgi:hypothetical protein